MSDNTKIEQVDYKGRSQTQIEAQMLEVAAEFDAVSKDVRNFFEPNWEKHQELKDSITNRLIKEEKHAHYTVATENAGILEKVSIQSAQDNKPFNAALAQNLSLAYGQFGMSESLLRSSDVYDAGFRLDQAQAYLENFKSNFAKSQYVQNVKSQAKAF